MNSLIGQAYLAVACFKRSKALVAIVVGIDRVLHSVNMAVLAAVLGLLSCIVCEVILHPILKIRDIVDVTNSLSLRGSSQLVACSAKTSLLSILCTRWNSLLLRGSSDLVASSAKISFLQYSRGDTPPHIGNSRYGRHHELAFTSGYLGPGGQGAAVGVLSALFSIIIWSVYLTLLLAPDESAQLVIRTDVLLSTNKNRSQVLN